MNNPSTSRLKLDALEINATQHCNYSCRGCTHISPLHEKKELSLEQLEKDLNLLRQSVSFNHIRILGGEPLLHPGLKDLIAIIRNSKITSKIRLLTNGRNLLKATEDIWSALDEIHISVYPNVNFSETEIDQLNSLTKEYQVELEIKYFDYFREPFCTLGTDDKKLIQEIYHSCKMRLSWSCHTIEDGFFYKCPHCLFIPKIAADNYNYKEDGLKLESTLDFREKLESYLHSTEPIASCKYCLGSVGKLFPHQLVSASNWLPQQERKSEELLDREYLLQLKDKNPDLDNMCVRQDWLNPKNRELIDFYRSQD